jgi:DNA-binding NarL/FixJ family response regulator
MTKAPPDALTVLAREMMSGEWTIASESVDGAHRCYAARRVLPEPGARRALSNRERQVLTRALRGESNKEIAFTLGVGASAVSTWLTRARRKIEGRIPEELLSSIVGAAS